MHTLIYTILQGWIQAVGPRLDMDRTTSYKNHDAKSPSKTTPDLRMEPATTPISMTPKKLPTSRIVIPDPTSTQHIMRKSHTYKARALDALLSTQETQKHHVETMGKKASKYLWNGNENRDGSTNYPARVGNGKNRLGNRRGNVITTPNQTCQQIKSRTMDKIIYKWDWQLSAIRWWTHQGHQQNILHQTLRHTIGTNIDLWLYCGGLLPT